MTLTEYLDIKNALLKSQTTHAEYACWMITGRLPERLTLPTTQYAEVARAQS